MKELLNTTVMVVSRKTGALYSGKVLGFRPGKFCIGNLAIINWAGGVTVSKYRTTRWFAFERYIIHKHDTARCYLERQDRMDRIDNVKKSNNPSQA